MIRSTSLTQNVNQDRNLWPGVTDSLGIYDENPNPVMRVSGQGEILYANRGSQALCQKWATPANGIVPEIYRQRIRAVIDLGKSQCYKENLNGATLHIQIVPVEGHDGVNIYGLTVVHGPNELGSAVNSSSRNETEVKRKTDFTRAAIHELRNPLTPIMAASEMLVSRAENNVTARLARQINTGAIELNARIGELFDLVRAEMGALVLDLEPVVVSDLLQEIAEMLSSPAHSKEITLIVETGDDLPEIEADRARLKEGLFYLADCALKRSPPNAIIKLESATKDGCIIVQISSVCSEIPDEIKNYLSARYSMLTVDRQHLSSVGLKLTLSKLLIELHYGTIQVTRHNQGNIFRVSLPVRPDGV